LPMPTSVPYPPPSQRGPSGPPNPRQPGLQVWFSENGPGKLITWGISILAIIIALVSLLSGNRQNTIQNATQATQQAMAEKQATFQADLQLTAVQQSKDSLQLQVNQAAIAEQQGVLAQRLQVTQAAISASQRDLQATQAAFGQRQIDLQLTQAVRDQEVVALYRQQAFPLVKLVGTGPNIVTVYRAEGMLGPNSERLITCTARVDVMLANQGGGKAGLIDLHLANDNHPNLRSLGIAETLDNDQAPIRLPSNFDAQSVNKFTLTLHGQVAAPMDGTHVTPYTLGRNWAATIRQTTPELVFTFANADPVIVPLTDFNLALPVEAVQPFPPSPFWVSEADSLGQACFIILPSHAIPGSATLAVSFYDTTTNQVSGVLDLRSGQCFSFPAHGDITLRDESKWQRLTDQSLRFNVHAGEAISIPVAINVLRPAPAAVLPGPIGATPVMTATPAPPPVGPFEGPPSFLTRIIGGFATAIVLFLAFLGLLPRAIQIMRPKTVITVWSTIQDPEQIYWQRNVSFSILSQVRRWKVPKVGELTLRQRPDGYELSISNAELAIRDRRIVKPGEDVLLRDVFRIRLDELERA
jgi:hypothetical protein